MTTEDSQQLMRTQREFHSNGVTRSIHFRRAMLAMLESAIRAFEERILTALNTDLGKSPTEAWITEIGPLYAEIRHTKRNLKRWSRPQRVSPSLPVLFATSTIVPNPYGVALVIAPWNYPFYLSMAPLIAAAAAGNTVILKPSEFAPATSGILSEMINEYFTPDYISVANGGPEVSSQLIEAKPDIVFFTGSTNVGRLVMQKAAAQLIPVVLELGGKSPCLVLDDADLEHAAESIVWGKFVNCGQTCIAPDFVMVQSSVKDRFVEYLKAAICRFYAPVVQPDESEASILAQIRANSDYGRIINQTHFQRLMGLMKDQKVLFGGGHDEASRHFSPTIIDEPAQDSAIMKEEIFGPLLPIIAFEDIEECLSDIAARARPLAFYVFTRDRGLASHILKIADFGGGCINDVLMHVSNSHLPFGGVGDSGMGSYHGKAGYDAFTYRKGVVRSWAFPRLRLRYPPYGNKLDGIKRFMR